MDRKYGLEELCVGAAYNAEKRIQHPLCFALHAEQYPLASFLYQYFLKIIEII